MFYVIYPELWKLLIKNENFVIVEQGGGGPFDVSGGPFAVLEILEKNSEFGNFFPKFWKIENMISSDYVLCYIPRALETLEKNENFVIG